MGITGGDLIPGMRGGRDLIEIVGLAVLPGGDPNGRINHRSPHSDHAPFESSTDIAAECERDSRVQVRIAVHGAAAQKRIGGGAMGNFCSRFGKLLLRNPIQVDAVSENAVLIQETRVLVDANVRLPS